MLYKLASNNTEKERCYPIELVLLLVYATLIIITSTYHELWRDEVRALSIVRSVNNFGELISSLKNEGHPFVWYAILWCVDSVMRNPLSLKVSSIAVALLAALVVLNARYLNRREKALWLFGMVPSFVYSVEARNYGIGMLFLFLFVALREQKPEKPILGGALLFLLANTSAYGCVVSCAILLAILLEALWDAGRARKFPRTPELLGFVVAVSGVFASALQMYPDNTTIVSGAHQLSIPKIWGGLVSSLLSHFSVASKISIYDSKFSPLWVLLPSYLCFINRPQLVFILFSSVIGFNFIGTMIYGNMDLRHQGFLTVVLFATYWMYKQSTPSLTYPGTARRQIIMTRAAQWLISGFLIFQIYGSYNLIYREIVTPQSPAPLVSEFFRAHEEYKDAIIIAEPDFYAETFPYYLPNRIYNMRESRFRDWVSFTTQNKRTLTLEEVVETAKALHDQFGVPVLFFLGLPLDSEYVKFSFQKVFVTPSEQREFFRRKFQFLKHFAPGYSGEGYNLYRYLP